MIAEKDSKAAVAVLPPELAQAALVDATTCAAAGDMSVSWWLEKVRQGAAPAPAVRQPRCTRWRVQDVRDFWIGFANAGAVSSSVTAAAKKASDAARVKRSSLAHATDGIAA